MDSPRCSSPYERIPPAPGTNQIVGFIEFRPLTSRKKEKCILLDVLLCSIAEYFYELCRILASPLGESKYKQRVKILSDTTQQNV